MYHLKGDAFVRKLLSFLLIFMLIISAVPLGTFTLTVSAATEGYYNYEILDGEAIITKVDMNISGDIIIPSTLGDCSVTGIGDGAFRFCMGITSITIPDCIISIGEYAFASCSKLTNLTIPSSVTTIGYSALEDCNALKKLTLPFVGEKIDGTTNTFFGYIFGADSYLYNYDKVPLSLKEVIVTNAVSIDDFAFSGCGGITNISLPDTTISIGKYAFKECKNILEIAIPSGVTEIGTYAFYKCNNLSKVNIGGSVENIGVRAFSGCDALVNINVSPANAKYLSIDGVLFNKEKTCLIRYPAGKSEAYYDVPDDTVCIDTYAFESSVNLKNVTVADSVKSIGFNAFYDCDGLEKITLPFVGEAIDSTTNTHFGYIFGAEKGYQYNGQYVPQSLKEVVITYATTIESHAFDDCDYITNITLLNNTTSIGERAFYSCNSLVNVFLPDSVVKIGNDAFSNCGDLRLNGYDGSYVQKYANEMSIPFVVMERPVITGDANGDGSINNKDCALIMQHINGWAVDIYLDATDVNDDGKINNKDYVLIMRYINGWDVVLK